MTAEQVAATATTYTTLDGQVLDLTGLTAEERQHLVRCYLAYRAGMDWGQFSHLVVGPENPMMHHTAGMVTPEMWRHPLYQAVRDLEDRLGIKQGEVDPDPGDDIQRDPLTGALAPSPATASASR